MTTPTAGAAAHSCGWPGCPRQTQVGHWGCRDHWYTLPLAMRSAIYRRYRALQNERTVANVNLYRAVVAAAEDFAREHDAKRGESHVHRT